MRPVAVHTNTAVAGNQPPRTAMPAPSAGSGSFLLGGHAVPHWTLVAGGAAVLLGAVVLAAKLLRGKKTATGLERAGKTKKAGSPKRGVASAPSAASSAFAPAASTGPESGDEEGVLLMGDEEGLSAAEREFRAQCSRFLTQLGNAGGVVDDVSAESSDLLDLELEHAIRRQLPTALQHYNAASRSLAAHLLLAVNAHYLTNSRSEEEFHRLMRAQHRDMLLAWQLLSCADENEWEQRTLDILRIQVAQCLKDASLMLPLLKRMASHPSDSWNVEEAMLLFTVAPCLGRWADTVRFGEHLNRHFPEAGVLHMSPASLDYEVLLELARERAAKEGDAPESQLRWSQYQIVSQQLRLVDVQASNAEMVADVEQQFSDPSGERSWQALQTTEASELVRCGAIAQLKSFSPAGGSLAGPIDDHRLYARGQVLLPSGRQRQVETYDMRRVSREELQGSGADDVDAEEARLAAEDDALASPEELEHGLDRDDALAARLRRGASPFPDEYWRGSYVMVQEELALDDEESQGHGHSHGGVACGHNHGGRQRHGEAAAAASSAVATASLTVTFQLEFVLRPRAAPTDEEPTAAQFAAQGAAAAAAASASASSMAASSLLGSSYVLASGSPPPS